MEARIVLSRVHKLDEFVYVDCRATALGGSCLEIDMRPRAPGSGRPGLGYNRLPSRREHCPHRAKRSLERVVQLRIDAPAKAWTGFAAATPPHA